MMPVLYFFLFLLRITRENLVTAIWKVKPILKWEIDSIQAVIDEEKENLQGKLFETTIRIFTREKSYSYSSINTVSV